VIVYSQAVRSDRIQHYEIEDSVVTLNKAELPAVQIGDIILLAPSPTYPFGAAKQVASSQDLGSSYQLTTTEPKITDVIQSFDFRASAPLTWETLASNSNPANAAITSSTSTQVQYRQTDDGIAMDLSDVEVDLDGQPIRINGEIELGQPMVHVDAKWDLVSGLKRFETHVTYQEKSKLNVSAAVTNPKPATQEKKVDLGRGFYVPMYGPFGVQVQPQLIVKGDLTATLTFAVEQENSRTLGFAYANGHPVFLDQTMGQRTDYRTTGNADLDIQAGIGIDVKISVFQFSLAALEGDVGVHAAIQGKGRNETGGVPSCISLQVDVYDRAALLVNSSGILAKEDIRMELSEKRSNIVNKSNCKPENP
jgi:hypothetical protein